MDLRDNCEAMDRTFIDFLRCVTCCESDFIHRFLIIIDILGYSRKARLLPIYTHIEQNLGYICALDMEMQSILKLVPVNHQINQDIQLKLSRIK